METKKRASELREEAKVLRLITLLVSQGIPFQQSLPIAAQSMTTARPALMQIFADLQSGNCDIGMAFKRQGSHFSQCTAMILFYGIYADIADKTLRQATAILDQRVRLMLAGVEESEVNSVTFFHFIAILLGMGHPILGALAKAGEMYLSDTATADLVQQIRIGETLTSGMKMHPRYFREMDCNFIEIGEMSGTLAEICLELATIKEHALLMAAKWPLAREPDPAAVSVAMEYRQLAHMVNFGTPLMECLELLSRNTLSKRREEAYREVLKKMSDGAMFSEALESLPTNFPGYIVYLITQAERMGNVDSTLRAIADHMLHETLGIEPVTLARACS